MGAARDHGNKEWPNSIAPALPSVLNLYVMVIREPLTPNTYSMRDEAGEVTAPLLTLVIYVTGKEVILNAQ